MSRSRARAAFVAELRRRLVRELARPDPDTPEPTGERPVEDAFYGDRSGWLIDPFGHRWSLSTPIEEVSREEMQRRVGGSYDVT